MRSIPALQAAASTLVVGPRAARLWRLLLALLLCSVSYLALTPHPPQQADFGGDKLNHLSAFAALAAAAALGFPRSWVQAAAFLIAFGGLIEVLQSLTPNRSGEWLDLLADAVGLALGFAVAHGLVRATSRFARQERCSPH